MEYHLAIVFEWIALYITVTFAANFSAQKRAQILGIVHAELYIL